MRPGARFMQMSARRWKSVCGSTKMDWVVKRYKCDRLVYFEKFSNIEFAIAREEEIKGWRRAKKDKILESLNPNWKDLAADWYTDALRLDGKPVKQ
jgi:predicted GIY-YIG superfamily endonuclease